MTAAENCAESAMTALALLDSYVDLVAAGGDAEERFPGIAAHLAACGPCNEDFAGLLAAVRE